MPCCSGHACDMCATCRLGVCCGDSGSKTQEPRGVPIGEPQTRPSTMPVEVPAKPGSVPAGMLERVSVTLTSRAALARMEPER